MFHLFLPYRLLSLYSTRVQGAALVRDEQLMGVCAFVPCGLKRKTTMSLFSIRSPARDLAQQSLRVPSSMIIHRWLSGHRITSLILLATVPRVYSSRTVVRQGFRSWYTGVSIAQVFRMYTVSLIRQQNTHLGSGLHFRMALDLALLR